MPSVTMEMCWVSSYLSIEITHRDTLAIYHSTVNNMSTVFVPIYCYHFGCAFVAKLKTVKANKIEEDNGRCCAVLTWCVPANVLPSKKFQFKFRLTLFVAIRAVDGRGYVGNSLSLHNIDVSNSCFISFHYWMHTRDPECLAYASLSKIE